MPRGKKDGGPRSAEAIPLRTSLLGLGLLATATLLLVPGALGHPPPNGALVFLDNETGFGAHPFSHTGVCYYNEFHAGYYECYGTWYDGKNTCDVGHWYWDTSGNYYFWCTVGG